MPPPKDPEKYAEWIQKLSESRKKYFENPENREKDRLAILKKHMDDPEYKVRMSIAQKKKLQENPEYLKQTIEKITNPNSRRKLKPVLTEINKDPVKRANHSKTMRERAKNPDVLKVYQDAANKVYSERPEVRDKISKSRIGRFAGENCPRWNGGVTPLHTEIRFHPKGKEWTRKVLERDGFRDYFSGLHTHDAVAHHVVPFSVLVKKHKVTTLEEALKCKPLWDINNGITLDRKTHNAYHDMWGKQ